MPNKDEKKKPIDWAAISERNLSGKGWTAADFGIPSGGVVEGGAVVPLKTTVNAGGLPATNTASTYVSPEDQAKIRQALQNPDQETAASGPVQAATSFLGRLFDYSDESDNVVEWGWDGLWRTLGWGYDRINQGASWAVSAAPGGIETFDWSQAGEISYGQASLAAGAKNVSEYGGLGGGLLNAVTSPFSMLGGILAEGDAAGPLGDKNFDVRNEAMRKAAFEDSTVGKVASGISDAVFTVVADPLLFAGKIAKVSKLKYLDDVFSGEKGVERLRVQMTESLAKPMEAKAPIAQFAAKTAEIDPVTGKKALGIVDIANRLKGATDREVLSSALYHNTDEETAQLIIRTAFGDVEAGKALLDKRPSIAVPMMRQRREAAIEILQRDPAKKQQLIDIALATEKRLEKQLDDFEVGSVEYNNILKHKNQAFDTYSALVDGKFGLLDDTSDPFLREVLSRELQDQIENDGALQKFLFDETLRVQTSNPSIQMRNAFAGSTKGFAADTAFGRRVEASRIARAQQQTTSAARRGQFKKTGKTVVRTEVDEAGNVITRELEGVKKLRPWQVDEFGANGFNRAVRVWRWFGEENPSGFIHTKGTAAADSWREVQAVVNDIDIYSGPARKVKVTSMVDDGTGKMVPKTEEFMIGGLERKNELMQMYMTSLNDSTSGADAAAIALNQIEEMIFNDISAWHGISAKAAKELKNHSMSKRDKFLTDVQEGFWVDEAGKKNKSPWLESQIQNGTFMMNYRQLNKTARLLEEDGWLEKLDTGLQFGGKNAKAFYDAFNEVWRPSVLLRLGYTQRNVMEGLFRASAFTFSLDPLRYAGKTMFNYAPRNAVRHWTWGKAADKAEVALRLKQAGKSDVLVPKKFTKWLEREIQARDEDIARLHEFIDQPGRLIEDVNLESRNFMRDFYASQEDFFTNKIVRAKNAGASSDELATLQRSLDDAVANKQRVGKITKFQLTEYEKQANKIRRNRKMTQEQKDKALADLAADNPELLKSTNAVLQDMRLFMASLNDSVARRELLNADDTALAAFRQQGKAKLRVHNGVLQAPDGTVVNAAFNASDPYTSVALSNLSADMTTRSMSVSAANTMNNAIRAHRMKFYTEVYPNDANYFNGVAAGLRQIKYSDLGKMAIDGRSADEIAEFLMKDNEGKQILEFIVSGENKALVERYQAAGKSVPTGIRFTPDAEEALRVAEQTIDRYMQLAPSPELRAYMKTMTPDSQFDGEFVKGYLSKANPDGSPAYDLRPVIGHIAEEMGVKSAREFVNGITSKGMQWLGTFPEDAMVRAPFYGKRYEDVFMQMTRDLQAQLGPDGKISLVQYGDMVRQAHKRALKDTKDWMFTIERRTNLGTYGEVAIPFISATQNSVTTVGRLIWNDPTVAVLMADAWRAPYKIDITDEEGNIGIPIPHNLIPDGLEDALGITNQDKWKFNISQINLIAPQFGEGTLFQFGPVVGVPVSQLMKHNFMGMAEDAPPLLKSFMGDEFAASVWSVAKDYTFGKDGTPQSSFADQLLPAWGRRVKQFFEKNDSNAYAKIYLANLTTEYLKWRGGLRENPPTSEELTNMSNNLTLIQLAANLVGAFPPQYESKVQPFVDYYRSLTDAKDNTGKALYTKDEADAKFMQMFGSDFLVAKDLGLSKGVASPTPDMVTYASRYSGLIENISAQLGDRGDLSVLSMLFNDDPNAVFDGTAYMWQTENNIPGVSQKYRERLSPEEAFLNNAKNVGWAKWTQADTQFKARLAQFGLSSFDQMPALQAERQNLLISMSQDPMYQAWFNDYKEMGASRTTSTVMMMQAALADPTFREDHADSDVWQAASQYLVGRAQVVNALGQAGGSIDSAANLGIKQWWDKYRAALDTVPGWDVFSSRYLDGDNDPVNVGVSFANGLAVA